MYKNIKTVLTDNEEILCDERVHWIVFAPPAFYALIALLAGIFFHPFMGALILFLDLVPIYTALVRYFTTHLALTNKKVLSRTGFLLRDWIQLHLDRIETAYLEEPFLGRLLGYSTVIVSGVGTGSVAFTRIKNGDEFVKKLEQELSK